MKIGLFQFNWSYNRPLLLKIVKECGITEVHNFWPIPFEYGIKDELPDNLKVFNRFNEIIAVILEDHLSFDLGSLEPLDSDILNSLSRDEHINKQTLLRWADYYPQLFNYEEDIWAKFLGRILSFKGSRFNLKSLTYIETDNLYLRLAKYFHHVLKYNNFKLLLHEFTPHGGIDNIAYSVGNYLGIPSSFCYMAPGTLYAFFMDDYKNPRPDIINVYNELKKNYKVDELKFREKTKQELTRLTSSTHQQTVPYAGNFKEISIVREFAISKYRTIEYDVLKYIPDYIMKSGYSMRGRFLSRIADWIERTKYFRKYSASEKMKRHYASICKAPDFKNDKYIYVTLHVQPEASSQPIGEYFGSQQLIIEMLSYHLPPGWKIYVKEHNKPTRFLYRPISFYENLRKLNNVQFIDLKYSSFELMEHCLATASVAGTSGWEGLFKGKPFLIFGNHITQYAPGAFRIRTNEDCRKAMQEIKNGVDINREDLFYFAKALEEVTIESNPGKSQFIMKDISDEQWFNLVGRGYIEHIQSLSFET